MAKHLSDGDVERVVEILDGWRGKLTWDALCTACARHIGSIPARQTLDRFVRIRDAYKSTKIRLREQANEVERNVSSSIRVANERLQRLTMENERLKRENSRLLEQFVVWQYNAHARGLTDVELNRPLPPLDRGRTE